MTKNIIQDRETRREKKLENSNSEEVRGFQKTDFKCANSKNHRALGFAKPNKPVKACMILNEMVGRTVCKDCVSLCRECIPLYYGKTFDEIRNAEMEGKDD